MKTLKFVAATLMLAGAAAAPAQERHSQWEYARAITFGNPGSTQFDVLRNDERGGEVRIVRKDSTCPEGATYVYSWRFEGDIRRIARGQRIQVHLALRQTAGPRCPISEPYLTAGSGNWPMALVASPHRAAHPDGSFEGIWAPGYQEFYLHPGERGGRHRPSPWTVTVGPEAYRPTQILAVSVDTSGAEGGNHFHAALVYEAAKTAVPAAGTGGVSPAIAPPTPAPIATPALNLTGVWSGDDGGTYYLRQIGDRLWWYGQSGDGGRTWTNVLHGGIQGNRIVANWADVPHGQVQSGGEMELAIASFDRLTATRKTGGFGGSVWTRAGSAPPQAVPQPARADVRALLGVWRREETGGQLEFRETARGVEAFVVAVSSEGQRRGFKPGDLAITNIRSRGDLIEADAVFRADASECPALPPRLGPSSYRFEGGTDRIVGASTVNQYDANCQWTGSTERQPYTFVRVSQPGGPAAQPAASPAPAATDAPKPEPERRRRLRDALREILK
jgi:hypothetical protein